jgi:2-polyprenyl-6-methoxyphenol hydroxylase-like FAD-dependent oxidoreductase
MAMDTPATIAIIGAGPLGMEAALYARYLGYDVEVFEQAEVGSGQLERGRGERLAGPFREYCSVLALQALEAQHGPEGFPALDAELTLEQWVDQYLRPLSETDLLAAHIRRSSRVVEVRPLTADEIESLLESGAAEDETGAAEKEEDGDWEEVVCEPLLVRLEEGGEEKREYADVVIAATGAADAFPWPTDARFLHRLGVKDGVAVSYREGLQQIRDLFAILADRPTLDLYR